jgi:hypothetical protein
LATVIQIADAVVAQLNATTFSQPLTAARHYAPSFKLPDMKELHVTVVPRAISSTSLDRSRDGHRHPGKDHRPAAFAHWPRDRRDG